MKTLCALLCLVMGFCWQVEAALIVRGTDSLGNRLIYDADLNITWYDFTYQTSYRVDEINPIGGWVEAGQWAAALTVYLPGVTYLTGWRLPSAGPDPQPGYNQTTPEMGHLYYSELGNRAYPEPGWGLQNMGPFQHLGSSTYWSAERYAPGQDSAWAFTFAVGSHAGGAHTDLPYSAIAVRDGDVPSNIVPPVLSIAPMSAASLRITWPTNVVTYVLECATNLPAAAWITVTNQVTTNASRLSVTVQADGSQRFYRLRQP